MHLISGAFQLAYCRMKQEWKRIVRTRPQSYLIQVMDGFFNHTDIYFTLFTWYQVEIKFWTKVNLKTDGSAYATAGIEAECHFVSYLICHDLIARPVFIWMLRFVFLLDQDDSLCHLCCHHNSFDTTVLWNHLENWRWWRNNRLSSKNSLLEVYIYISWYISSSLRNASCINLI